MKNKILNEIELSEKKIKLRSVPRTLKITLTNICHLKCIMCCDWRYKPWKLPKKRIDEIIGLFPYLEHVLWQGGEVFLLPYFKEIFEQAAKYRHLRQSITTNGLLIDEDWAKSLARKNVALIYSIDGFSKKTYEHIRRGAKFPDLIKSIKGVLKYRRNPTGDSATARHYMNLQINFVVMKSNYEELDRALEFAREYRFDVLNLLPIKNVYSEENIFLYRDKKALEYIKDIMPRLASKAKRYQINLLSSLPTLEFIEANPSFSAKGKRKIDKDGVTVVNNDSDEPDSSFISEEELRELASKPRLSKNCLLCRLPWQGLFIGAHKKVRPECFCPVEVGHIEKESIGEIWNSTGMQLYRHKLLSGVFDWCNKECTSGIEPEEKLKPVLQTPVE